MVFSNYEIIFLIFGNRLHTFNKSDGAYFVNASFDFSEENLASQFQKELKGSRKIWNKITLKIIVEINFTFNKEKLRNILPKADIIIQDIFSWIANTYSLNFGSEHIFMIIDNAHMTNFYLVSYEQNLKSKVLLKKIFSLDEIQNSPEKLKKSLNLDENKGIIFINDNFSKYSSIYKNFPKLFICPIINLFE